MSTTTITTNNNNNSSSNDDADDRPVTPSLELAKTMYKNFRDEADKEVDLLQAALKAVQKKIEAWNLLFIEIHDRYE